MTEIIYPNFADTFIKAQQAKNAMYDAQMAPVRMQNEFMNQRIQQLKMREAENEFLTKMGRQEAAKDAFRPAQPAQTAAPMQTEAAPSYTGNAFAQSMYGNQVETAPAVPAKFDSEVYKNALGRSGDIEGIRGEEDRQVTQKTQKMGVYKPLYDAAVSSGNNEQFQMIVENMKREGLLPADFKAEVSPTGEVESVITIAEGSVNPSTGQPWTDPVTRQRIPPGKYSATAKGGRVMKLEPYKKDATADNAAERLDIARERLDLEKSRTAAATQRGKRLPTKDIKDINEIQDAVERLDSLSRAFKDEYGGKFALGGINTKLKDIGGMDTGQVNWWKDYKELDAVRRNAIFGASLTGTEKSSWNAITVNERSDPKTIQQAVVNRVRILSEAYNRRIKSYEKGGYDVEEFAPLSVPDSEGFTGSATPPKAGPAVGSVNKGYRFKGGDPAKKENWEKI